MNTTENSATQPDDYAGACSRSAQAMPMETPQFPGDTEWVPVPPKQLAIALLVIAAGVLAVPAISFVAGWLMRGPSCG